MYGQTNYASQFGQGPQKPWPPAYQQRAAAPPPPPPPTSCIQPGPPFLSHPITQQTNAPPPHAGQPLNLSQPGSHGLPPPLPPLYQGPSVQGLHGGITNIRQTYFHTFPPVHGSTQVSQFNSNAQQNVTLSHSRVQNTHHVLPPPPPLPPPPSPPPPPAHPSPDLLRPTQPSTIVPRHPPSEGQMLYGAQIHSPLLQGGLQVFPSIPQHSTTSNFHISPSFARVVQSNLGEPHLPAMTPPPPPSSPPPVPPSPPPPTSPSSSTPNPDSSNLSCQSEFDPTSTIHCSKKLKGLEIDQGGAPPNQVGDNGSNKHDDHINLEGGIGLVMDSKVDDEISNEDFVQVLPPPPPKPKDDEIVRKIEVLCQLIANNGSSFEDTTRHKEFGNPEFEFLFGGEPGTESAVGHEYFLWMKKYNLARKSKEMEEKSPSRSLSIEPQSKHLAMSAATISPANSDMEMEDDITPSDIGEEASHSFEIQSYESKSRKEEHDVKGQLLLPKDLQRSSQEKEKVAEDGGPKLKLDHEKSISVAACQVHSPVRSMAGVSEQPLETNFESFVTCLQDEKNIPGEVAASETINSSQSTALFTDDSPFRLIQDYSSDEDSESDKESHPKDVSLVAISPSPLASSKTSDKDSDNLTILGSKASCKVQRSSGPSCESSMRDSDAQSLSEFPKLLFDANEANVGKTGNEQSYNNQKNQICTSTSSKSLDVMNTRSVDVHQETDNLHKENDKEKVKLRSSPVKIDEFGRLVREGGSDSDSDDLHYTRRHKYRRTRNSSESRSPVDRRGRRSPYRRKERRSRSRSWSPHNQRGRSRSPASRRTHQRNSENMRRDKGMIQKCFDFQRGRCYRGASCRYVHHEPNKNDGSILHRSKHHDIHPTSKNIKSREDIMNISTEVSDLGYTKVENQKCFQHNVSSKDDTPDWKTERPTDDPDSDVNTCQSSLDSSGLVKKESIYSKSTGVVLTHAKDSGQEAGKSDEQRSVTVSSQGMSNAGSEKFSGDISTSILTTAGNSVAQQSYMVVAELQTANSLSHQMDGSFLSNLSPDQVTVVTINKALECEHYLGKTSSINPQFNDTFASQPPMTSQFLSLSPVPKPLSATASGCATGDTHSFQELPPPPPLTSSINPKFDDNSANQPPITSQYLSQSPVPEPLSATTPGCAIGDTHSLRELPPPPPLTSSINPQFDDNSTSQPPMTSQFLSQSPVSKPVILIAPGCATDDAQPLRVLPPPPPFTSSINPQFDDSSARHPPMASPFLSHSPVPKPLSATAPGCATDDTHLLREMPPLQPLIMSCVTSAEVSMPSLHNFVPQNVSFPSKSSLPGGFQPHQDFVSIQPSHYHGTSLLPPKPFYDLTSTPVTLKDGMPMQFHQSHLSQGSDLGPQSVMKSQPLQLHSHSKLGESPGQELYRAPMHMNGITVANNQPNQPFGFPSFHNEENFGRRSVEMNSSNFFPHRNLNDQSMPFTNTMLSSGDNFPPSEFQSSFSQFHPPSLFQQPLYSSQPTHDGLLHDSSQIGNMSRHYLDPRSRNHSSLHPDFGGLGATTYHNPHASTFEKPYSSSFRSNILNFANDVPSGYIHDSTFNVNNVRVDGQGANYVGSRLTTASPNSTKPLGKLLPSSGGDQYDPLFDSIEPSPPKIKKSDRGKKLEKARESHMMSRLGGSHKLLDVEENNRRKEVAAVASTTSVDNDEFGETADAEAGDVENDFDDEADLTGEIEIDQVKSPEKSKKSKGSRSLRLFRVAIANFVKEILKPSWRQGNMSKEAFKTIVKKTVDKVSGAMKSHQIPKSQTKINRYMDSSQRKLTKLVMGYVDKYVKT